jgi:para-aminobenzoate synthetase component I
MKDFVQRINALGNKREPFFFMIDFALQNYWVGSAHQAAEQDIYFSFPNKKNHDFTNTNNAISIACTPISYPEFLASFTKVQSQINYGNSFLCNLTCSTPITIDADLQTIFTTASAKYKVLYKNIFTCFSPETFVQIANDNINTYPMKGTIDATIPDAQNTILQNPKEKAEHYTIVDLLRNDLATIATNIKVEQFRYTDIITTATKSLLQISSNITGQLAADWHANIGNLLQQLLPAGSISGAPKQATLDIITDAETHDRGYYTGIAGYYDGTTLDSCVLIRFIENTANGMVYKSGGGITCNSIATEEYAEMIQKIYIPT